MKKINIIFLISLVSICLTSSNEEDVNTNHVQEELKLSKLLGTWQMYRSISLENAIIAWTGPDWTTQDIWYSNLRKNSKIFMGFSEDGSMVAKHADVPFNSGKWIKVDENRVSITFDSIQSGITERDENRTSVLIFYCDNTISIISENDDSNIRYYAKTKTKACDKISYKVN